MTKVELLNRIVENHNRIANVEVRGDNTLLISDTLRDLRYLIKQLQSEPVEEENKKDGLTLGGD